MLNEIEKRNLFTENAGLDAALELVDNGRMNHAIDIRAASMRIVEALTPGTEFTSGDIEAMVLAQRPDLVPREPRVFGAVMRSIALAGLAHRQPRTTKVGLLVRCVRSHSGDWSVWRRR